MTAVTPTETGKNVGLAAMCTDARRAGASGSGWIAWNSWARDAEDRLTCTRETRNGRTPAAPWTARWLTPA